MPPIPIFTFDKTKVTYKDEYAIYDVSFSAFKGETIGLVGESGSGKSTVAKAFAKLIPLADGSIFFYDTPITSLKKKELFAFRKKVQILFQDPDGSMNPRKTALWHLQEVLSLHFPSYTSEEINATLLNMLPHVQLEPSLLSRYAYELSGGQKQRLLLARALLVKPEVLLLDEPLSSLDASLRRTILSLLLTLQKEFALTYLFITHDLSTVSHIAQKIAVLYRGSLVEWLPTHMLSSSIHPYTQHLIASIPIPNPRIEKNRIHHERSEATPPHPIGIGCPYAHKCPKASPICHTERPKKITRSPDHFVLCHKAE